MMTNVAIYSWGQNGYMLWTVIASSLACGQLGPTEKEPGKTAGSSPPTAVAEDDPGQARH